MHSHLQSNIIITQSKPQSASYFEPKALKNAFNFSILHPIRGNAHRCGLPMRFHGVHIGSIFWSWTHPLFWNDGSSLKRYVVNQTGQTSKNFQI